MIINIDLYGNENERLVEVLFEELLRIVDKREAMRKEQTRFTVIDGKVCFE